ncbi:MAG TPA: hypothetical protein VD813_10660 [Pseudonocardia sp.]|nr:hypothetical protein [Pseudonocardia sp.]
MSEQTATIAEGTAPEQQTPPPAPAPVLPGRKTTVTLGPFLAALTAQDRAEKRPTVAVTIGYTPPTKDGSAASRAVQTRLVHLMNGGMAVRSLQQVAEELLDWMHEPAWLQTLATLVADGFRVTQVNVALLPRDQVNNEVRPIATVTVNAPEI